MAGMKAGAGKHIEDRLKASAESFSRLRLPPHPPLEFIGVPFTGFIYDLSPRLLCRPYRGFGLSTKVVPGLPPWAMSVSSLRDSIRCAASDIRLAPECDGNRSSPDIFPYVLIPRDFKSSKREVLIPRGLPAAVCGCADFAMVSQDWEFLVQS